MLNARRMHTADEFINLFNGHCTYESFHSNIGGKVGATARMLAAEILSTPLNADDVHATIIKPESARLNLVARWVVNNTTEESKNIIVLFAKTGTFVYQPATRVKSFQVGGKTERSILDKLGSQFQDGYIAHIKWSVAPPTAAESNNTIARLKAELADAHRLINELIHTNRAPEHAPVQAPAHAAEPAGVDVATFHTYDREIRGFTYEYSDDFRPDLVPAAKWDANLLYKYMHKNRSNPDAIFPKLLRIISCTPRHDLNCDFGVVFEHPVSKVEVELDMCKAFATVCKTYQKTAYAYQIATSSTMPGRSA